MASTKRILCILIGEALRCRPLCASIFSTQIRMTESAHFEILDIALMYTTNDHNLLYISRLPITLVQILDRSVKASYSLGGMVSEQALCLSTSRQFRTIYSPGHPSYIPTKNVGRAELDPAMTKLAEPVRWRFALMPQCPNAPMPHLAPSLRRAVERVIGGLEIEAPTKDHLLAWFASVAAGRLKVQVR